MLDLAVPPDQIDVNIHPMKLEIRFLDSQRVYQLLQQAIHATLGGAPRPAAACGAPISAAVALAGADAGHAAAADGGSAELFRPGSGCPGG